MRRPLSVWLVQALLAGWTVVAFTSLWRRGSAPADAMLFFAEFVIKTIVFLVVAYAQLTSPPPGKGLPRYELSTPPQQRPG